MFAVIFGRPGCPYCVRAKELAEKLTEERDDFNFRYVDIHAEGISKADLEKTVGKCHRFSSTRNTSVVALILKLTQKKIWRFISSKNIF
jgi:glutaredoxin